MDEKVVNFKAGETIPQVKDAFKTHYGIEFFASPAEQVASRVLERPERIRQILVGALSTADLSNHQGGRRASVVHRRVGGL